MEFPFNPINRAEFIERMVSRGTERKYHRFRPAPYYGGIATADALGCCFLCAYCWNYKRNLNPEGLGKFYTPSAVATRLLRLIKKRGFKYARITGAEPILGQGSFRHFAEVVGLVLRDAPQVNFILETNGLLLGYREDFIKKLRFPNLSVRIAIKGWDSQSFQEITGARGEYFLYPLKALKGLIQAGIDAWPAVMKDFFGKTQIESLKKVMEELGITTEIETEVLERYPHCMENISKRGLKLID